MEELWIAKKNDDGGREKKRTKVEFERVDVFDDVEEMDREEKDDRV